MNNPQHLVEIVRHKLLQKAEKGDKLMKLQQATPSRRTLLGAAIAVSSPGCAKPNIGANAPPKSAPALNIHVDETATRAHLSSLERKYGARLGVYALNTGTSVSLAYRADDRFAFCSTFKTLAVAAVLQQHPLSYLDTVVTYTKEDVNSISPITQQHAGTGLTIGQLCDAAVRYSDGTAGNLLMRDIGGPAQLTAYLRSLDDTVSRMDQYEPELNRDPPEDPRDTTTPRAIAADYRKIVLGDALPADKQSLVKDWLRRNTTGTRRIRVGVPSDWIVADKTGTGDYGRAHDIAIAWPPSSSPLIIAIMSDRVGYDAEPREDLIADAAKYIASVLK